MSNQLASIGDDVSAYVEKLKSKGAEFAQAYQVHMANYDKVKNNPALFKQWNDITVYANKVRDVIQTVNGAVDSSVNWLRDVFGLNGVPAAPQLGAIPLIGIAYVTGAITALTWVVGKIYEFNKLVNMGATTEQLTRQSSSGMFSDVSDIVKWGVIGFGIYMAWKKWGK